MTAFLFCYENAAICYVVCAGVRANAKNVAEKYIFLANISLYRICFVFFQC